MKKAISKLMPATMFLSARSAEGRFFLWELGVIIAITVQTAYLVYMLMLSQGIGNLTAVALWSLWLYGYVREANGRLFIDVANVEFFLLTV